MSGAATGTVWRHPARWIVLLLVAVIAIGGIAWAVAGRHTVHVGDRYDDRSVTDDSSRRRLNVRLPLTRLDLRISSGDRASAGEDEVEAPDGASMVQVTWAPSAPGGSPVWGDADARERRDPGTQLVLVTGGRRYPLAEGVRAGDVGSSVVVVVQGKASDARIEARYGGRTVRATSGTADVLGPRPIGGCQDPSEPHPDRVFLNLLCSMPLHRAPYVPGLGAAPAGKEWLVLYAAGVTRSERDATVYPPGSDAEGARYVPSGKPTVSVTAEGVAAPPKLAGEDVVEGDSVRLADRAWLVPEGAQATVHLRYRLPMSLDRQRTDLRDVPARHDIDVRGEAVYPAAEATAAG